MVHKLYPRLLTPPESSFFLFGARGVGKSTWVRQTGIPFHEINLLEEDLYQSYLARPELFRAEINLLKPGSWVFVDEIQRIPGLLNEVHRAIEKLKLKFILSGSSARRIVRGGANLLAGRAILRNLFPLTPIEMGKDFHLDAALEWGTLPVILAGPETERKERLKVWVQTYLREEIQAEALVRNLGGFIRFLPVAALFNAQIVNVSNVARDCGVERTTVSGYLEILNDTLVTFHLPAYEGKLRVRERKHQKLYWLDPGIVRTARGDYGKVAEEERGALFESFIAQTLRSFQHYQQTWDEMYYWAPTEARGIEVDFLLKSGRDFVAIEVKSGSRLRPEWMNGLNAIAELPRLKRRMIVYLGDKNLRTDSGIDIVTLPTFLDALKSNTLFSSAS